MSFTRNDSIFKTLRVGSYAEGTIRLHHKTYADIVLPNIGRTYTVKEVYEGIRAFQKAHDSAPPDEFGVCIKKTDNFIQIVKGWELDEDSVNYIHDGTIEIVNEEDPDKGYFYHSAIAINNFANNGRFAKKPSAIPNPNALTGIGGNSSKWGSSNIIVTQNQSKP